jgi:hypothetical protein
MQLSVSEFDEHGTSHDDIQLPKNRLADQLRAEQYALFRGETWLQEHLAVSV